MFIKYIHAYIENKNGGSMIHVREAAPFYFSVFFGGPLAMIAARQPGAFFSNRLAFFSETTAFFSKNTLDDSLWLCCFWTPNTPKKSRRASRAGLLDFPIGFAQFDPFSTGFIRFFDMVKRHVRFIYKPNAFLIILMPFCDFDSGIIKILQVL